MRQDAERKARPGPCFVVVLLLVALLAGWPASLGAQNPAAETTPVFQEGLAALEAGDPQSAFDIWTPAAEAGEPLAQYGLGKLYETGGPGFPPAIAQAVAWYEKAAESGVPAALNNLGRLYAEGRGVERDTEQAILLWAQAAQLGHPHAQYNLGLALFRGEWVEQDRAGAVEWFLQSAAAGLPEAQFAAGQIFERGLYRETDARRAVEWYRRAAAQGHVAAGQSIERLTPSLERAALPPVTQAPSAVSQPQAAPSAPPPIPPRRPTQAAETEAGSQPQEASTADPAAQPQPAAPQVAERSPTPTVDPAETATARWRVWLGSAADPAEAEELAERLTATGPALGSEEIETVGSNGGLRLLAGRFGARAAAEELCRQLRSETPTTFCIPIED